MSKYLPLTVDNTRRLVTGQPLSNSITFSRSTASIAFNTTDGSYSGFMTKQLFPARGEDIYLRTTVLFDPNIQESLIGVTDLQDGVQVGLLSGVPTVRFLDSGRPRMSTVNIINFTTPGVATITYNGTPNTFTANAGSTTTVAFDYATSLSNNGPFLVTPMGSTQVRLLYPIGLTFSGTDSIVPGSTGITITSGQQLGGIVATKTDTTLDAGTISGTVPTNIIIRMSAGSSGFSVYIVTDNVARLVFEKFFGTKSGVTGVQRNGLPFYANAYHTTTGVNVNMKVYSVSYSGPDPVIDRWNHQVYTTGLITTNCFYGGFTFCPNGPTTYSDWFIKSGSVAGQQLLANNCRVGSYCGTKPNDIPASVKSTKEYGGGIGYNSIIDVTNAPTMSENTDVSTAMTFGSQLIPFKDFYITTGQWMGVIGKLTTSGTNSATYAWDIFEEN